MVVQPNVLTEILDELTSDKDSSEKEPKESIEIEEKGNTEKVEPVDVPLEGL